MNEWREVKLEDITTILGDGLHGTPNYSEDGEYYFINGNNLSNGRILVNENTKKSNQLEFEKYKKELNDRTILVSINGTLGNIALYNGEKCFLGKSACYFNIENNVDKYFIYYTLNSNLFKNYIENYANGTTIKNVSLKAMRNFSFPLPPLQTQHRIAAILSSLDDKIENNRKTAEKLEEIAQAIFKRWFVDFEFPNEDGEPYKSSGGDMVYCEELGKDVPKGWKTTEFEEIVKVYNGYSYKGSELEESNDAMVTIKCFDRNGGYKIDGLKEIKISDRVKSHHYVDIGDIIVAHTDITQKADIIGRPIMIISKGKYEKLIMSMDTVKVESKKEYISNEILYYIINSYDFLNHALGYVNGTTVLHLSKKAIPEYKLVLSNDKLLYKNLNSIIKPMLSRVKNILIENQSLINLRDTLLPKLMSGEIEV